MQIFRSLCSDCPRFPLFRLHYRSPARWSQLPGCLLVYCIQFLHPSASSAQSKPGKMAQRRWIQSVLNWPRSTLLFGLLGTEVTTNSNVPISRDVDPGKMLQGHSKGLSWELPHWPWESFAIAALGQVHRLACLNEEACSVVVDNGISQELHSLGLRLAAGLCSIGLVSHLQNNRPTASNISSLMNDVILWLSWKMNDGDKKIVAVYAIVIVSLVLSQS